MEDRVGGGDAVRRRLEREVIDRRLDRVAPRLVWDLYYYKSELLSESPTPPTILFAGSLPDDQCP